MSFRTLLSQDIPNMYRELADAIATYKSDDINVISNDDYEVESIKDKVFNAQTSDFPLLATGETMIIDDKTYEVVNFTLINNDLEVTIALSEV